jgi:DNA invertase Pin-like site-specific DNA recombinase
LKLLKEYAAAQGFTVAQELVDVETAKQTGRAGFGEMVAYLRAHPAVRVLLVEKTDRLYRNLKDWVTVDELDVEIPFAKEGVVLSHESRSSEKFMHGIKVLMAKNYIDNLLEEARKGMQEKAEQGIWPTVAPLGYRNVAGPDGKRLSSLIRKLRQSSPIYSNGMLPARSPFGKPPKRFELRVSFTARGALRYRRVRFTASCAIGCTQESSSGTAADMRESTSRSSRRSFGSECKACSMAVKPTNTAVQSTTSPSQA